MIPEMQAWLSGMRADGFSAPIAGQVASLVALPDSASVPRGTYVTLSADGVFIDGEQVTTIKRFRAQRIRARFRAIFNAGTGPPTLILLIQPEVHWADISWVAQIAAQEEYGFLWFGFRRQGRVSTPSSTLLDAQQTAARAASPAEWPRRAIEERWIDTAADGCAAVKALFQPFAAGRRPPTYEQFQELAAGVPDALRACDCDVDLWGLQAILSALAGRLSDQVLGGIALTLANDGGGTQLLAPGPYITWGEGYEILTAYASIGASTPMTIDIELSPEERRERDVARQKLESARENLDALRDRHGSGADHSEPAGDENSDSVLGGD